MKMGGDGSQRGKTGEKLKKGEGEREREREREKRELHYRKWP